MFDLSISFPQLYLKIYGEKIYLPSPTCQRQRYVTIHKTCSILTDSLS
jgi:hypothetical protein